MIRLLALSPLMLIVLLTTSWTWVLFRAARPEVLWEEDWPHFAAAYRQGNRGVLIESARAAGATAGRIRPGVEAVDGYLRFGRATTALHARASWRLLPLTLLLSAAGLFAGLSLRERLRNGDGHASPAASRLGSLAVVSGLLGDGLFALSPVPCPYGTLYLSTLAMLLGVLIYAANLPLRL